MVEVAKTFLARGFNDGLVAVPLLIAVGKDDIDTANSVYNANNGCPVSVDAILNCYAEDILEGFR